MSHFCRHIVLALCFALGVRSAVAGENGWSMHDERYCCFASGMTLQELASGGVTVLSHTPASKEYCEEARRWGIKACPYVSLYKVIDSSKGEWPAGQIEYAAHLQGLPLFESPFWKELDVVKHPEWCLLREDGQVRRPFDEPNYRAHFQQSCCNHHSLIDAYERGVRNVMDLGAGGVFIDNIHPSTTCFGAKLGLHTHDWPDKNNAECYGMALKRVYDAVKSCGKDRVVILNPGGPAKKFSSCGDCVMWESFIWRSAFDGDKEPLVKTRRWEPRTWDRLLAAQADWRPQRETGPSVAPLTYLPDPSSEAENAFFAFAAAQLAGFEQWTGTCGKRRDILRRLYRLRPGKAISEIVEAGGVAYRQFENALIVCNHSDKTIEVRVPVPPSLPAALVELFDVRKMSTEEGNVVLSLPPESGRIVVVHSEAVRNLLQEVEGQALAARLHLAEKDAVRSESDAAALQKELQEIETRSAALRTSAQNVAFPTPADREELATLTKSVSVVKLPPTSDAFLTERLSNLRSHADLAADLMAQ